MYLNIDEESVFVYTEPRQCAVPGLCLHSPRGPRIAFHTKGGNISLRLELEKDGDKESVLCLCVFVCVQWTRC